MNDGLYKNTPATSIRYDGVFYNEKTGFSEGGKKIMDEFAQAMRDVGMTRWWFMKMRILRVVYGVRRKVVGLLK